MKLDLATLDRALHKKVHLDLSILEKAMRPEEEERRSQTRPNEAEGLSVAIFDRLDEFKKAQDALDEKLDVVLNMLSELQQMETMEQEADEQEPKEKEEATQVDEGDEEEEIGEEEEPSEEFKEDAGEDEEAEEDDEEEDDLKKALDLRAELEKLGSVEAIEEDAGKLPEGLDDLLKAMPVDKDDDPTKPPAATDENEEEDEGDEEDELKKALDLISDCEEVHVIEGSSLHDLFKAVGHKYLRRYKTKSGKYAYVYASTDKKSGKSGYTAKSFKLDKIGAGDKFNMGNGTHVQIDKIEGDRVTFTGTDGKQQTLDANTFGSKLLAGHKKAITAAVKRGLSRREDILKRAEKHGTEKQKELARGEVAKWKEDHKEYLPQAAPQHQGMRESLAGIEAERKRNPDAAQEHYQSLTVELRKDQKDLRGRLNAVNKVDRSLSADERKAAQPRLKKMRDQINTHLTPIDHALRDRDSKNPLARLSQADLEAAVAASEQLRHATPSQPKVDAPKTEKSNETPTPEKPKEKAPHEMTQEEYVSHQKNRLIKNFEEENKGKQISIERGKNDPNDALAFFAKEAVADNLRRIEQLKAGKHDERFAKEHVEHIEKAKKKAA